MKETCHIWMSYVAQVTVLFRDTVRGYIACDMRIKCLVCAWVMTHMNETCQIWMRHLTYEWVLPHMNESWRIWTSHDTYELDMSDTNETSHLWIGLIAQVDMPLSDTVTGYVTCHIWMSHVRYEWDMSHMWDRSHVNESYRTGDRALKWRRDRIRNVWHVYRLPLLQNILSFIGLRCKRDLQFQGAY